MPHQSLPDWVWPVVALPFIFTKMCPAPGLLGLSFSWRKLKSVRSSIELARKKKHERKRGRLAHVNFVHRQNAGPHECTH